MTTNTRYPVLRSRIPQGGRQFTRAEQSSLAALGVAVPQDRTFVMPAHASDYIGALYRSFQGGLVDLGVSVTLRP